MKDYIPLLVALVAAVGVIVSARIQTKATRDANVRADKVREQERVEERARRQEERADAKQQAEADRQAAAEAAERDRLGALEEARREAAIDFVAQAQRCLRSVSASVAAGYSASGGLQASDLAALSQAPAKVVLDFDSEVATQATQFVDDLIHATSASSSSRALDEATTTLDHVISLMRPATGRG